MKKYNKCNCINDLSLKIIELRINKKENPKGYKITDAEWENIAFYPKRMLYSNFKVKSIFEKKDGTMSKEKTENISIFYSFCPFCGKKIDQ